MDDRNASPEPFLKGMRRIRPPAQVSPASGCGELCNPSKLSATESDGSGLATQVRGCPFSIISVTSCCGI